MHFGRFRMVKKVRYWTPCLGYKESACCLERYIREKPERKPELRGVQTVDLGQCSEAENFRRDFSRWNVELFLTWLYVCGRLGSDGFKQTRYLQHPDDHPCSTFRVILQLLPITSRQKLFPWPDSVVCIFGSASSINSSYEKRRKACFLKR